MYEEFYGLKQLPFQLLPDPDFFYRSQKHDKALTYLEYGVFERAGFIVITGEIGTGKTTLLRYLLRSIGDDIPTALINQTFLPPAEFLRMLCQEFSLAHEGKGKSELIELFGTFLIEQYKAGRYVILILDEAQNLPPDTLEEIRMLSNLDADNERLLQIILVGQPPLRNKLHREELRQLLQRVEVSYHLEPLDREDLREYIHYRLETAGAADPAIFENATVDAMYDCTGGVPRLINSMCHRCLVYGFADGQKKITPDLFDKMLDDRKAEGLHPQDAVFPSTPNASAETEASEAKNNPGNSISPAHLAATIDRLTEISGASIKAIEMAAARAANSSGDAELALLKRQLAEERLMREKLESRLNQTENELTHLEQAISRKNDTPGNQVPAHTGPVSSSTVGIDAPEEKRAWLSLNPVRYMILILIFIVAMTAVAMLVLWHPRGNDPKVLQSGMESRVSGDQASRANALKRKIDRTQTKNPLPTAPDTASQPTGSGQSATDKPESADMYPDTQGSETRKPQSAVRKTLINSDRESVEADRPPAAATHQKVPGTKLELPRENSGAASPPAVTAPEKVRATKPKAVKPAVYGKYVCVVEMANVRALPRLKSRVLGRITQGTEVDVIGKEGKWMHFKYQGKTPAWIYGTLLQRARASND